jgi:ribosomal protein S18 acetylase RimI-like enzyme
MIDEAADWLRTKDTNQWAQPWPNRDERDARVLRGLLACRTWLVEDYGIPVATVTYRPDGPDLWTDEERRQAAVYMSRLVVRRKYAGVRVGADLTNWAGARAKAGYSAELLRIDVWTDNIRLHAYYQERGFYFHRFCTDKNYPSAALFYKPTSDISQQAGSLFWEIPAIPQAASTCRAASQRATAGHTLRRRTRDWNRRPHHAARHAARPARHARETEKVPVATRTTRPRRVTAVNLAQLITLAFFRRSSP